MLTKRSKNELFTIYNGTCSFFHKSNDWVINIFSKSFSKIYSKISWRSNFNLFTSTLFLLNLCNGLQNSQEPKNIEYWWTRFHDVHLYRKSIVFREWKAFKFSFISMLISDLNASSWRNLFIAICIVNWERLNSLFTTSNAQRS